MSSTNAQIGELGIYGSAPTPASTPFPCGEPSYAQIHHYPDYATGDGIPSWSQTLPLNGLKNFNFFYTADGTGFLPGGLILGGYIVTYLNSSQVNCYGSGDIVSYSPNSGHTNGVQVRPFVPAPTGQPTPLGIHGLVYGYNSVGAVVALHDLNVWGTLGTDTQYARTNGSGYFSIYYSNGNPGGFLGAGDHRTVYISGDISGEISGDQRGCAYFYIVSGSNIIWAPDTNPSSSGYYVSGAEMDVTPYIPTLPCL